MLCWENAELIKKTECVEFLLLRLFKFTIIFLENFHTKIACLQKSSTGMMLKKMGASITRTKEQFDITLFPMLKKTQNVVKWNQYRTKEIM